jgi:cell division protein ZapA
MQDNRKRIVVDILGTQYTMIGNESEEYIQSVAMYVDKRLRDLQKRNGMLNNMMVAILTAVNITDELFKLQQEYDVLKKEASKPSKELEDARYQLRKAKETIASQNSELESLRLQLANSQEEASGIYDEWLKAQKEIKELKGKLEFLEDRTGYNYDVKG